MTPADPLQIASGGLSFPPTPIVVFTRIRDAILGIQDPVES
jgi:hypothetical protein